MFGKTKVIVKINGMDCEHCARHVKTAIENLDGVDKVEVNLKKGEASVPIAIGKPTVSTFPAFPSLRTVLDGFPVTRRSINSNSHSLSQVITVNIILIFILFGSRSRRNRLNGDWLISRFQAEFD